MARARAQDLRDHEYPVSSRLKLSHLALHMMVVRLLVEHNECAISEKCCFCLISKGFSEFTDDADGHDARSHCGILD
jgi:hypothetical protein